MNLNHHVWRQAEGGLERISVEGGWIYRDQSSGSIAFVPGPQAAASRARPLREVRGEAEERAA